MAGKKGAPVGNKNAAGGGILGKKKPGLLGALGVHELNAEGRKVMKAVNKAPKFSFKPFKV
jgi:hypothetical protein